MPGHSLEQLRASNRRAVTNLLGAGPLSRADLARGTGLSRTTVSSLVSDLIASGHVAETTRRGTPHKGGSGRPPLLVELTTRPGGVAGVDIGHGHIRVAVADRSARVLAELETSVDADMHGSTTLDLAARMVTRAARDAGTDVSTLLGAGMCVPGPIDRRSSLINVGILPGWHDIAPAPELERRLGLPVVAENDANLGAIAEHQHGAAEGSSDVIYVKVASGLGSGIVLGGRLHRGATGIAGEIGHIQVREDGQACRCGSRGCLESEVSTQRLLSLLRPAYDADIDVDRMLALDRDGDTGVRRVLSDAGRTIGRALADLCTSLNPAVIVVGGSLGSSEALVDGVRASVDRYAQPDAAAAVRVASGRLGDRAELIGAVSLAIARVASQD
jgi:predicted NBD/HSP70 family sugar kinase